MKPPINEFLLEIERKFFDDYFFFNF